MPTIETLKTQAKLLRAHFSAQNIELGHSQALEAIAAIHGFKDWNTASARSPKEFVYPTTNETLEQLHGRWQAMANAHAQKPDKMPLTKDEAKAAEVLLHQIGVALAAAKPTTTFETLRDPAGKLGEALQANSTTHIFLK
ncbi:MAG: glyoxalase superfamily protein [Pseudomonas sp.]